MPPRSPPTDRGGDVSAETSRQLAAQIQEIAGHCMAITEAIELLNREK
jgi:hypothetical protein